MKHLHTQLALLLILIFILGGCKKEEPTPEDENELITTVRLKFTENGTTTTQTFEWKDLDGDGGNAPTVNSIILRSNRTYKLEVEFLDESKTPATNKTTEIQAEADEHLVVLSPNPSSLFSYTPTDKDSRNFPIGLTGTVTTSFTNMGTLRVQLRHQPPINGQPVKNGTVTPGSDDVNVTFNLTVAP